MMEASHVFPALRKLKSDHRSITSGLFWWKKEIRRLEVKEKPANH